MKIAIIAINKKGEALAKKIKDGLLNARIISVRMRQNHTLKGLVKSIFNKYEGIVFISAVGIAVRVISPFTKNKFIDPAVVSVDSAGRFAVSVLSGHEGGANRLAYKIASIIGALPIVTTGEEVNKRFVLGIGTRKGISPNGVKTAIRKALIKMGLSLQAIRTVASVELKKKEHGLINACSELGLPLVFVPKESIRHFRGGISVSQVVRRNIGLDGVC
ncbi:MAG: cobalamin biosynthesis protein [Candidatus Omnitrophota bacterium]